MLVKTARVFMTFFATGALVLAAAGIASAHTGPWQSTAWPDDGAHPDVIGDCNRNDAGTYPDSCPFHQVTAYNQVGGVHQVGNMLSNCGSDATLTQTITQTYISSTEYSYSESSSFSTNIGAALEEGITGGVDASSSSTTTWSVGQSVSTASAITISIPPHSRGALYFQPNLHVAKGWIEARYNIRVMGHYIWYYPGQGRTGVTVKIPVQNSDHTYSGTFSTRSSHC